MTRLRLHPENHLVERSSDGTARQIPSEKYYVPGSVLRVAVDNTAPELSVTLERSTRRPGMTEVSVTQPNAGALSDLKRVELQTPRGSI